MYILPGNPFLFIYWWFIKTPKHIFVVCKRFISIVNNTIAFTLNIRLVFTPLFGDYTFIGRLIGFIVRVLEIIVGIILMIIFLIISLLFPLAWLVLPIFLFHYIGYWVVLIVLCIYAFWSFLTADIPSTKIINNKGDTKKSFRNSTKVHLKANPKKALLDLLNNPKIELLLKKAEIPKKEFFDKCLDIATVPRDAITKKAFDLASEQKSKYVEVEHLFYALLENVPKSDTLLSSFNTDKEIVKETIKWLVDRRNWLSERFFWQEDYVMQPMGGIGKGLTGRVTPLLDTVSTDYTRMVQKGKLKQIIGREKEIEDIAQILSSDKGDILLIGPAGCGKTSIVQGIAYEIIAGTKYKTLKQKRIVRLDIGGFLSETRSEGEIAGRINKIMEEVKGSRDIVLFIDEIHTLMMGENSQIVYSTIEPYLASSEMHLIGATSTPNYRKYIEPQQSFAQMFHIIEIGEASQKDTLEILKYVSNDLERKNKIFITYTALVKIIALSEKLIHERVLPDKAIDILSRAASQITESTKEINSNVIAEEISTMTRIPVENVSQDDAERLLNIEKDLKKMVVGQDHAIVQVANALRRARTGMRNEKKPIASFLFVGTTGVGKTQTAKALAKTYFGDAKTMIRLDMSEYQQANSIDRLIGSPDGSSKGLLTEQVRSMPFALILLDEIEKAHPKILQTFLQVLDDARLTDASGTTVDFTNTIIISTSNVGTREIQEIFAKSGNFEEMETEAMKRVRDHFAPEFLNRFNGIVVYHPLSYESVFKIAQLLLRDVAEMAKQKGIKLDFKKELIQELVKKGFSPEWGARPLSREIENSVENYLARKVLSNEIKSGDEINLGLEVFGQ